MSPNDPVLNISTYKFVALEALPALRERVKGLAVGQGLKGTVLLAPEGINLFLAGTPDGVHAFIDALTLDGRLSNLAPKESWSRQVPFKRLIVKIKPEIIRMNQPAVRPDRVARAPDVSPETLQRWLTNERDDDGRPVVTLDTRNDFEVTQGRFDGAIHWSLGKFSDFPEALRAHRAELQGKTVVSYCTGGIRCEKAVIAMQQLGLTHVHQLDGGILNYFERVGPTHWTGSCFVFDERVALDTELRAPCEDLTPS